MSLTQLALSLTHARAHAPVPGKGKVQAGQEDREITVLPRRKAEEPEEPDDTTTVSVIHLWALRKAVYL